MIVSKKKLLVYTPLFALILVAVYPFESTVVPAWKVKVIDVDGVRCQNMPLFETWGHYSLFLSGNFQSEDGVTDREGFVEFPERRMRAIGIRRLVMPFVTEALTIAHGSTGVSGSVHASGLKDVAWLSYKGTEPLPETARVEKCIVEADLHPKEER
jgi:hypothetical protein